MKGFHYPTMSYAEARERLANLLFRTMTEDDWSSVTDEVRQSYRDAVAHLIEHRGWVLSALTGDLTDHDKLRASVVKHMSRAAHERGTAAHEIEVECTECHHIQTINVTVPEEKLHDAMHAALHGAFADPEKAD